MTKKSIGIAKGNVVRAADVLIRSTYSRKMSAG